jgi:hypothetical protein
VRALVAIAIVGALAIAGLYGARQVYFLGVDEGGRVALYRGLPYDLPFGIELYDERYSSPVQVDSLPPERRSVVTDHELRSHDDASSLVTDLEEEVETAPPGGNERSTGKPGGGQEQGGGGRQGGGQEPKGNRQTQNQHGNR